MTRTSAGPFVAAALAGLLLAACAAPTGSAAPPPSAPPGGAVIVAQGLVFDRTRLEVPAGVGFTLLFENREGAPHNVTILDVAGAPGFVGDTFSGPGSRTYAVPPMATGTYRFRCDVHTDMAGTVVAGAR